MQLALKGHLLMTLINPEQLLTIIKNVRKKIPVQYSLPYASKKLDLYFKYTPVQVISNGSLIIMALMLHLVRDDSVYELFKAIQVPSVENGEATKCVVWILLCCYKRH